MKKILIIGGAVFLITSGIISSFGKKDSNKFDDTNNGNVQIEQELPEIEENTHINEDFNEIDGEYGNSHEENTIEEYEMTAEFKGFADSHSVEIYANGEYQVMQVNDNATSLLKNKEVGEEITIIYSTNEFGSNTILDLK